MSKNNMIVRVEKSGEFKGNIIGVLDEAEGRNGMLEMFDPRIGFTACSTAWYQTKTRPATAVEEAAFCESYETRHGMIELKKRRSAR